MVHQSLIARIKAYHLALTRRIALLVTGRFDSYPQPPRGIDLSPSHAHFTAYESVPLHLSWGRAAIADPQEWQEKARAKLAQLIGYERMETPPSVVESRPHPIPVSISGSLEGRAYYLVAAEDHIPVTVVRPQDSRQDGDKNGADAPLPVMLCLHGHNSGVHLSWGETRMPDDYNKLAANADYALQAVRHGYAAVCIEQSCFGERREKKLTHPTPHLCFDAVQHTLLLGRTLLGERASDVSAVIDWLQAEGKDMGLDPARIHVMGNSAGGEAGLYAAALDSRIGAVIASGCVGAYRDTIGCRSGCADAVIPGILQWLENDDVLRLCAPRPLVVVSGVNDHLYPFSGAAAMAAAAGDIYGAMGVPEMLCAVSGPGGHRFYPDQVWPAFMEMTGQG